MNLRYLPWLIVPSCAGTCIGLLIDMGNLAPALFLALAGLIAGAMGAVVVTTLHRGFRIDRRKTSLSAIAGAVIGAVAGGYWGATSGFGIWMIATFNPGLPEMDFAHSFGLIGGVFIGSFAGALTLAGLVACARCFQAKASTEPNLE